MNSLWPKTKPASDDKLIPLINIVFLLLIFFMVAGQMHAQTSENLQLPISNSGTEAQPLTTRIELNANMQLFFNSQLLSSKELSNELKKLSKTSELKILLHRHLTATQVQPLLTLLREQQFSRITLISESQG